MQVTDTLGDTASGQVSITIDPRPPLKISEPGAAAGPAGTVGTAYPGIGFAEVLGQLGLLGRGKARKHPALQRDLSLHELVLVGHQDVFAGAHGQGARHQGRDAGQHDRLRRYAAAAESAGWPTSG